MLSDAFAKTPNNQGQKALISLLYFSYFPSSKGKHPFLLIIILT